VWTGAGTDPVNAPKLLALGAVGFSLLGVILRFGARDLWLNFRPEVIAIVGFILSMVLSVSFSQAPISQTFYGSYGRNNGFLTYFLTALLFLGALLLRSKKSFQRVIYSFLAAGVTNLFYCVWVLIFGDPIPWNNTYKNILGLLGNPNFISSFLGMFITGLFAFVCAGGIKIIHRSVAVFGIFISAYLVLISNSIQGIFVSVAGMSVVIFLYIRARTKGIFAQAAYFLLILTAGTLSVLGMLQKGPLSFVYKKSVSLRGTYWNTGIEMGKERPWTGIGMDTYGDWYRRARPPVAFIDTPGPGTHSNAAHNVFIDMFASGGWPLLISYLGIVGLGIIAAVKLIRMQKSYDPITAVLLSVWIGYEAQSIISINQIGLAIWGWLLPGLLIAYAHLMGSNAANFETVSLNKRRKKNVKQAVFSPQLIAGLGLILGVIIAVPPLSSDARWFTATQSRDLAVFKNALVSDYLHPTNSQRIANAAIIFQNSNLTQEAHQLILEGIKFNPDYFESYLVLYNLTNASESEKKYAMQNMKRLDPNNPNVLNN
jgi:O-antigen ligase